MKRKKRLKRKNQADQEEQEAAVAAVEVAAEAAAVRSTSIKGILINLKTYIKNASIVTVVLPVESKHSHTTCRPSFLVALYFSLKPNVLLR